MAKPTTRSAIEGFKRKRDKTPGEVDFGVPRTRAGTIRSDHVTCWRSVWPLPCRNSKALVARLLKRVVARDHQTFRHGERLRGLAATLGDRAHTHLARPLPQEGTSRNSNRKTRAAELTLVSRSAAAIPAAVIPCSNVTTSPTRSACTPRATRCGPRPCSPAASMPLIRPTATRTTVLFLEARSSGSVQAAAVGVITKDTTPGAASTATGAWFTQGVGTEARAADLGNL
jgi:hypothetical protein